MPSRYLPLGTVYNKNEDINMSNLPNSRQLFTGLSEVLGLNSINSYKFTPELALKMLKTVAKMPSPWQPLLDYSDTNEPIKAAGLVMGISTFYAKEERLVPCADSRYRTALNLACRIDKDEILLNSKDGLPVIPTDGATIALFSDEAGNIDEEVIVSPPRHFEHVHKLYKRECSITMFPTNRTYKSLRDEGTDAYQSLSDMIAERATELEVGTQRPAEILFFGLITNIKAKASDKVDNFTMLSVNMPVFTTFVRPNFMSKSMLRSLDGVKNSIWNLSSGPKTAVVAEDIETAEIAAQTAMSEVNSSSKIASTVKALGDKRLEREEIILPKNVEVETDVDSLIDELGLNDTDEELTTGVDLTEEEQSTGEQTKEEQSTGEQSEPEQNTGEQAEQEQSTGEQSEPEEEVFVRRTVKKCTPAPTTAKPKAEDKTFSREALLKSLRKQDENIVTY